jgi:MFS family permease
VASNQSCSGADDGPEVSPADSGFGSKPYRVFALAALLTIYVFNAIDRTLLAILQEKIKLDLSLSDFQLGLLGGPAFVILYTSSQIPIARLAERRNRISIISMGAAAWSIATAACGLAQNFIQLALARIAVGIGEASCIPPSHSVISDYFPRSQRATALAVFALGIPLGTMIAALAGGFIAETWDWRWAFILLGMPGVLAALILVVTVKEPPRDSDNTDTPSFLATLIHLFRKGVFVHTLIGSALFSTFTFSLMQFLVSFFIRNFEMEIGQASAYFGLIAGVGSMIGMFLGGFLFDRLAVKHPGLSENLPVIAAAITTLFYFFGFQQSASLSAVTLLFLASTTHYFYFAPMIAMSQNLAEPRMRATASAITITTLTLIGYGIGPPLTGAISDFLNTQNVQTLGLAADACSSNPAMKACVRASGESLRTTLLISVGLLAWATAHFWIAACIARRARSR